MRAVAVHEIGDEPELMELPMPRPAAGEIVVELAAASVNPIDMGIAGGHFPMPRISPLVLGVDGAGRVTEVGEGVRGLEVGDAVHGQFLWAPLGHGTFAQYALVTQNPESGALQRVPDGMPAEVAAALPTAGMTALGALDAIGLQPGHTILIIGATGGVGVFAVQLAAARGAEVIATARPEADRWIRGLGAARTVDYTLGEVAGQVRATHPGGVHAVLDLTRDPAGFTQNSGLVIDGGAAVSAALVATPQLLASERIAVSNFLMTNKPDLLARITAEAAAGRITVPIQRTLALDEVPEALVRGVAGGGARGKTTVRI